MFGFNVRKIAWAGLGVLAFIGMGSSDFPAISFQEVGCYEVDSIIYGRGHLFEDGKNVLTDYNISAAQLNSSNIGDNVSTSAIFVLAGHWFSSETL